MHLMHGSLQEDFCLHIKNKMSVSVVKYPWSPEPVPQVAEYMSQIRSSSRQMLDKRNCLLRTASVVGSTVLDVH